jgi:hypothetical protein
MEIAIDFSKKLGKEPRKEWIDISKNYYFPINSTLNIYLEYEGYNGEKIKQADVILLVNIFKYFNHFIKKGM